MSIYGTYRKRTPKVYAHEINQWNACDVVEWLMGMEFPGEIAISIPESADGASGRRVSIRKGRNETLLDPGFVLVKDEQGEFRQIPVDEFMEEYESA
jgi:hypothetical protein